MRAEYQEEIVDNVPWLKLPARDYAPYTSSSLQYGAGKVARAYCNLKDIPTQLVGGWFHGWYSDFILVSEHTAVEGSVDDPRNVPTWVGTKRHEEYLHSFGYKAKAIGLPYAYLPARDYARQPGSLLVMPAHSLEYTKHAWRFEEYVDAIDAIRDDFTSVTICIYPACFKNGYWVENFKRRGYPIIEGAHAFDRNSIERIRALMSQFEFVTTNNYGSCIAYGCAFGAKVSLYGPYAEFRPEDAMFDSFFLARPGVAEKIAWAYSEQNLRKHLGDIFVRPSLAIQRLGWGLTQIGKDNIVSPDTLKHLFGWNGPHRIRMASKRAFGTTSKLCLDFIRRHVKALVKPRDAMIDREIQRLKDYPENTTGIAVLHDRRFQFANATSFLKEHECVFWELYYDFPCIFGSPMIIDACPGCGLAVRFWLEKFPSPRIIAMEPDAKRFEAIQANVAYFPNADIQLFCDRSLIERLLSPAAAAPTGPGHSENTQDASQTSECFLDRILEDPVDFLNLPPLNGWMDTLLNHPTVFKNVKCLHFEYTLDCTEAPRLDELLVFLKTSGFRYQLKNQADAKRPLYDSVAQNPASMNIDVWAWRVDC